jgi:hypothetical protein
MFSFMLIAMNFVSIRFTGGSINAGLLVVLFMLCVFVIMLPGIIAAIFAGAMFPAFGLYLPIAVLAAWEMAVALVCFYFSRAVLHNCDMVAARQIGER